MLKNKKCQSALELAIILIFVLVILSFILAFVGRVSVDFNNDENRQEIDDFANSILKEFEITQDTLDGYYRTFYINAENMRRFNATINETASLLIITDNNFYGENSGVVFFYDIPGRYNISQLFNTSTGELEVTIRKLPTRNYQINKIDLSNQ
jgi:hypothetical protein